MEMVNSLDFMKMLVLFIFQLQGIRKFLAICILVFHLSIYYNSRMELNSPCLLLFSFKLLFLGWIENEKIGRINLIFITLIYPILSNAYLHDEIHIL